MIRSLLHASAVGVGETVDVDDEGVLRHEVLIVGETLDVDDNERVLEVTVTKHEQPDATREAGYCET